MIGLETKFHQPRLHYSPYRNSWRPAKYGIESLSRRELEVCKLIARGKSIPEVAVEIGVSCGTVWNHRYRAIQKLGMKNSTVVLSHFLMARGVIRNLYADEPNG